MTGAAMRAVVATLVIAVACARPPRPREGRVMERIDRDHVQVVTDPVSLRVADRVRIDRRHCARRPRPQRCTDASIIQGTVVRALDERTFIVRLDATERVERNDVVKRVR